MTATRKREIGEIAAPYGRNVKLDEVAYESGMTLLRVTIREGGRFTILEIDAAAAGQWGKMMMEWAQSRSPEE
ncbi:hypothetical protein QM467_19355 [Rhodoblastus sp. 17X3]|jgi:hypothetical protein|uniref:DUF6967 family protein n=1 Tax=Rhodoblastus sp. 17X3 TaxID=3047026 RepID=UPI0024B85194|nr:hypothetical protein [Rhodoblastus sp. 17X3]MDI9850197.1 hypothetical protein [Rhodoblastus sp. 17X3]MDI9850198.1 hypothetical protein [Rhodoblastus sp. 17X3]